MSRRKRPFRSGGVSAGAKLAKGVSRLVPILIILSLLLAACGAADEPAASEEAAPAAEESAPAAEESSSSEAATITGPVLTDPPAGAGEREVQSEVYNTPADAGGIDSYQEAPALAEMVASGSLPPVEERLPINALMPVALPDNASEALTEEAERMLEAWEVVFETLFIQSGIDSRLLDALTGWLEDNGPMRTVRELSLVPGFDPESLNKLSPLVTVYGSPRLDGDKLEYPKVNVNTASREVLYAIIDGVADGAGDVTGYVDDIMVLREDNLLQSRQIESTSELQSYLPTEVQAVFDKFATVQGTYFTVTSVARVEDIEKTVVAVLRSGDDGDEPIYFKVE